MSLSFKIILLMFMLLGFLAGNAFISWQEVKKIEIEFNSVVRQDLTLMRSASSFNELQLKKEIIFEKLTSSAEELAFGNVNSSRRQYLIEYIQGLQEQFSRYSQNGKEHMSEVARMFGASNAVTEMIAQAVQTASRYDTRVENIFIAALGNGYELSMEDIDQVQMVQAQLSNEFKRVLEEVSARVEGSIKLINEFQQESQRVLLISLVLSVIVAFILTCAIVYRLRTALKRLMAAVQALDQGQLGAQIVVKSSDEIGQVNKAFNQMSDQLKKYNQQMQDQHKELSDSLALAQEQKREVERINRDLDRFVHLIGHDIKGPLTSIMFYSDYLKKHAAQLDAKGIQAAEGLFKVSGRLSAMMHDLLEMTKITRVKRPFVLVDIAQVIKEALDRQEDNIQKTSAVIRIGSDFPQVMGDRVKLTVVFFNLIGNAVKYSFREGVSPQVDIRWKKTLNEHVFSVKDNGIGISKEHYSDVFEMFRRLPDAEHVEGTGVGLAMVRDIVHEHGGRIWVESVYGAGSEFFFSIPLESRRALG